MFLFFFNILCFRHGHTEWSYRQFDKFFQQRGLDSSSPQRGRCYCHHQQREGQKHTSVIAELLSLLFFTLFFSAPRMENKI